MGMDSGVAPLLLPSNKASFLLNATVRNGYATHRPPFRIMDFQFPSQSVQDAVEQGLWQGGWYYQADSGVQSLIAQIGGRLFLFTPNQSNGVVVSEITILGDPNPADIAQAWIWQSEMFAIVQNGQSKPIFFDGAISRRSNSDQVVLGTVDAPGFTAPAVGATVPIPLVAPGFTGQIGDRFFIDSAGPSDGALYESTYPPATPNATVTNLSDTAATRAVGDAVIINPNIWAVHLTSVVIPFSGTFPPNGVVIVLHLDQPYTGPTGVLVTFLGKNWEVTTTGGVFIGIQNKQTVTLNFDPIPAGHQFPFSGTSYPITNLGTVATAFTPGAIGASQDVILSTPYTGANGQSVFIGTGHYTIDQKAVPPSVTLYAININDTAGNAVSAGDTLLSVPELPPGRMGCYGMGRNWVCLTDGRRFIGSDIVGDPTSGTDLYDFRDSVLKTTENTFLAGGGYFIVPGNVGEITAMIFTATLDTSLGQGPLQVFTSNIVFSVNAPVDRTTWQNLENPILTQSLISNGALGQNSTIQWNNDTLFRAIDGIRSLILARREFNTWGNVPISHEMDRVIVQDDLSLLQFSSAVAFDNRMLMTSKPVTTGQGVTNRGFYALNAEPLTSIGEKSPSVYDGLWTGLNTLQVIRGRFFGQDRCFAFSYNNTLQKIELYEILEDGVADNNGQEIPITWQIETGCFFKNVKGKNELDLCKLLDGEIYVADVSGRVRFQAWYREQFDPCWHEWTDFSICATEGTNANIRRQNRVRLGLGRPPVDSCDPANKRSTFVGETFQLKLVITGHCRLYGGLLKSSSEPRSFWARPVCGNEECRLQTCPPDDDYGVYNLQDRSPVPPDQEFLNNPRSYCQECPEGDVLQYTGSLPFWLSINEETNCLTAAGGIIHGATQQEADDAIQVMLDNFVSGALVSGSLECGSPVSFFFVPEDSEESDLPTSGVCANGVTYFAVGAEIYTTTDGTDRTHIGTAGITAGTMTFGGGLFVITDASSSQIQTSPDGVTWTNRTTAVAQIMRAGVYANGRFVLVGQNGSSQRSSDGINWTSHPTGGADGLRGVTFGNSLYVACGENGVIFTSPDGATWTARVSGEANVIGTIATDGTNFVAVCAINGNILTSPNGITWTVNSDTTSGATAVAFGASTWCIGTGDNSIWSSSDGINYTLERTGGASFSVFYVVFCVDKFAALQFIVS